MSRSSAVVLVAVLAVTGAALGAGPASAQADATPPVDLIVGLSPAAAEGAELADVAGVVAQTPLSDDLTTVTVAADDVAEVVATLADDPAVAYVEPDALARVVVTPGDPFYGQQWGTAQTGIPQVWDTTTGASGVVVAVIDTGVNTAHEDLAGVAFRDGYDFVNGDAAPDDDHGHGTGATGIIAAQHNALGVAGVCPACTIMPLKAMDEDGTGSHSAIAAAINHAVDHQADIINLSLGSEASTITLQAAVRRATNAGILVVAAAGNAGVTTPFYPAAYPEALGVVATDQADGRYSWSNYGTWSEVAAPGCNLAPGYAPVTNTLSYTNFCGTSSAAPVAAGIAGLLASAAPDASGAQLGAVLQSTALPLDFTAAGRIDAVAALAALTALPPPPGAGSGGGTRPPEDSEDAGEPADTAMSVTPSKTVVGPGQSVELGGRVARASGSPEGIVVTLQTSAPGAGEWDDLAQQTTDDAGDVTFARRPNETADYRMHFEGEEDGEPSVVSDVVTVEVRPELTASAAQRVLAGATIVVRGAMTPARRNVVVTLQRRLTGGWQDVATDTTNSTGVYRLPTTSRVGADRYRVRFAGDLRNAGATSDGIAVVGERVVFRGARPDASGEDRGNLNGEHVVLRNTGRSVVNLKGWTLRSASTGRTFSLRAYELGRGSRVVVHSGRGRSGNGHLYLGARREVWRNHRDTGVLRHPAGGEASRITW